MKFKIKKWVDLVEEFGVTDKGHIDNGYFYSKTIEELLPADRWCTVIGVNGCPSEPETDYLVDVGDGDVFYVPRRMIKKFKGSL